MGKREIQLPIGLILAGGRGSRMGGADKALLSLSGAPLLAHVAGRLAPQVSGLIISSNHGALDYAAAAPSVPVLADAVPGQLGPLAGILAGLDHAAALGQASVVSVAVDTPFFPLDLTQRLLGAGGELVLAESPSGLHPTFGLWPVALRYALRGYLEGGGRAMRGFAEAHGAVTVWFGAETPDPFFNINTPSDLALAQRRSETD